MSTTFFDTVEWAGRKVALLLPWYKYSNPATAFSIMAQLDRTKIGVLCAFGDAFVAHSRNVVSEKFLASGIEYACMIDDDIVLPWGNPEWFREKTGFDTPDFFAGMKAVERLLSHGKTLVGACYFDRQAKSVPVYCEGKEDKSEADIVRRGPRDILKPTKWVGTGCMLIHRSVFLDIEKVYPHLARKKDGTFGHWFTSSESEIRNAFREALEILGDELVAPERRASLALKVLSEYSAIIQRDSFLGMGEDVIFCRRAAKAGHQAYVDLGLRCGHMGLHAF